MSDRFDEDHGLFGDEVVENSRAHLQRNRLFTGAGEDAIDKYERCFSLWLAPSGTRIPLAERDTGWGVYLIRRGKVRIEQRAAGRFTVVMATLGAADVFGLESLFRDASHPNEPYCEARCVQETLFLVAPASELKGLLDVSHAVCRNVASVLAQALYESGRALDDLRHVRLTKMVLYALEKIAVQYGVAVRNGTLLDVSLDENDIAIAAQCTPSEAILALRLLERVGKISANGTSLTILAE